MGISQIVLVIALILILNFVFAYLLKTTYLTNFLSGKSSNVISSSSLNKSGRDNSVNYAYSIWIYIDDWTYRYGEDKIIYARGQLNKDSHTISQPCPSLTLGSIENTLNIRNSYYSPDNNSDILVQENKIEHVPLQRWVNVIVSVYGRSVDVYLDGKMVNTYVLPGISSINQNEDVYLTPFGGFSGYTSRFQYLANSVNPQQAWDIYTQGSGQDSGLLNTKIKVSFSTDGQLDKSFVI